MFDIVSHRALGFNVAMLLSLAPVVPSRMIRALIAASSVGWAWSDGVVPFAVKAGGFDIEGGDDPGF